MQETEEDLRTTGNPHTLYLMAHRRDRKKIIGTVRTVERITYCRESLYFNIRLHLLSMSCSGMPYQKLVGPFYSCSVFVFYFLFECYNFVMHQFRCLHL